jgi:hypothetical protein
LIVGAHAAAGGWILYNGVKVFSATKAKEREALGDNVTTWIRQNPDAEIVDKIVTQSSDSEFHCLTITLFYNRRDPASAVA